MVIVLLIAVVISLLYFYRKNNKSNYFLSISFPWHKIYEILEISSDEYQHFNVGDAYKKLTSNNAHEGGYSLVNDEGVAQFEYYIIPKASLGAYPCSNIFDQQNKTFFESPNTIYREVMKGKSSKGNVLSIACGFTKFIGSLAKGKKSKSCFWISSHEQTSALHPTVKTIVFLFDSSLLNIGDAHNKHGFSSPCEAYFINDNRDEDSLEDNSEVKKLDLDPNTFYLVVRIQSQQDAQSMPFSQELLKFFKQNQS